MNLFNVDNDINYLLLTMGKPILINGNPATAIVGYSNIKEYEEKKIITKAEIKRGDLLYFNNHNYLITNEINDKRQDSYYKGYARSCNYNIKFNFNGDVKEFPTIISTEVLGTTADARIPLLDGQIRVSLQDNEDSKKISIGQRFLTMGYAFEVEGKDLSSVGLVTLNCSVTEKNPATDDLENEIVDRWLYETKHNYTLETTNTNSTLEQGKTLQFVVVLKDNGVVVENPTIIYSANNNNCSVDSTGLITANAEGESIITASFTSDGVTKTVSITITVTVAQQAVNEIQGDDEISWGMTSTYKAVKSVNGVVEPHNYDFTLENATGLATLTIIDNSSCKIKANEDQNEGYITLRAVNLDENVVITKVIYIKGFW
jgi:uncharacterized protein YjdB